MKFKDEHIDKIANSDVKIFKKFYNTFYPSLCLFVLEFVKVSDVSSDLAQEAFIKYWNKKCDFSTVNEVKSYLYTIAKNSSLNYLRSKKVVYEFEQKNKENECFVEETIVKEEVYAHLHGAIEILPNQSKRIIKLALRGYKNQEIASELNISVNSVKTLKKGAYRNLRLSLKENVVTLALLYDLLYHRCM